MTFACTRYSENYGEKDFNLLKTTFQNDSKFQAHLDSMILSKDSASLQLKKFIESDFQEVKKSWSPEEFDLIIHSFYVSQEVFNSFKAIDDQMGGDVLGRADSVRENTDSLLQHLNSLRIDMDSIMEK